MPFLFALKPHFDPPPKKGWSDLYRHFLTSLRFEEVEEDFDEIKAVLDPEDSVLEANTAGWGFGRGTVKVSFGQRRF